MIRESCVSGSESNFALSVGVHPFRCKTNRFVPMGDSRGLALHFLGYAEPISTSSRLGLVRTFEIRLCGRKKIWCKSISTSSDFPNPISTAFYKYHTRDAPCGASAISLITFSGTFFEVKTYDDNARSSKSRDDRKRLLLCEIRIAKRTEQGKQQKSLSLTC